MTKRTEKCSNCRSTFKWYIHLLNHRAIVHPTSFNSDGTERTEASRANAAAADIASYEQYEAKLKGW